jgi:thiamine-phosphate pyrophosphorylase
MSGRRARLYLATPQTIPDPAAFERALAAALAAGDVASLLIDAPGLPLAAARALCARAQAAGAAVLVRDDPALVAAIGADGLHLSDARGRRAARKALPEAAILGAEAGLSRHDAMEAAERGADYVALGPFHPGAMDAPHPQGEEPLLVWWQAMMETPCIAWGDADPGLAETLARAGADFICASSAVWTATGGPAAGVAALNAALDRAAG